MAIPKREWKRIKVFGANVRRERVRKGMTQDELAERAEIIREKGTNRSRFLRGQVDKYTWVDQGSSYLPSEINAAVLDSQLEHFDDIQERRFAVWNRYASELAEWASANQVTLMT